MKRSSFKQTLIECRTVAIGVNGIGPFIWIPFANVYGRRPIYLLTTAIGFATALACGFTHTFGQLVAARVFNGLFPVAMALGPATVNDLFFFHQRGRAMGVFTVALTSGAHFASLVGGPVGQFLGWRWCFKLTAIMNAAVFIIIFFCLPETLYVRHHNHLTLTATEREVRLQPKTYLSSLRLWSTYPELKLRLKHFVIPSFKMAKYPSVLFPALYYSAQYSYAAILPAVTVATIFKERYHWDTLQTGLSYGGTFTIGSILGEASNQLSGGIVYANRS
jgi:MFS family permease